jgi:hypothetical protein
MNGGLQPDPVRDAVLLALASYGGIAGLVVILVSGLKKFWKSKIEGREPMVAVALTYVLGCAAKAILPVYGGNNPKSWALHLIVLLVVAVGAKGIHDGVLNAFIKKEKKGEEPK